MHRRLVNPFVPNSQICPKVNIERKHPHVKMAEALDGVLGTVTGVEATETVLQKYQAKGKFILSL